MSRIELPIPHKNQLHIINNSKRFNTICCGRRFGKNIIADHKLAIKALEGKTVAHVEPIYRNYDGPDSIWKDLSKILEPAIVKKNESTKILELNSGGTIEFWSLEAFESIRGRHYHHININEAAQCKYLEEAWIKVIRPTLVDYKGSCDFLSTPRGSNYFKTLFDKSKSFPKTWASFQYTSYDNPKLSKEEIDEMAQDMPELVRRQEINAEFVDGAGTLLDITNIKYFTDVRLSELSIYMGVDLAISQKTSADYTTICVLGKNNENGDIYILDIYRDRITFNDTLNIIQQYADKWNPITIGVENNQYQAAVTQELLRTTILPVQGIRSDKDKVTRFQPLLARFEQNLVYINEIIPDYYEKELLSFPNGIHDDMVDATSIAFNLIGGTKPFIHLL